MARRSPRCAHCPHTVDSHLPADNTEYEEVYGCLYCDCTFRKPAPPKPPPLLLAPDAAGQLLDLARAVVAGIALAEGELAAISTIAGRRAEQIRAAYVAGIDLIHGLGLLLRAGELTKPLQRSTLVGLAGADLDRKTREIAYARGWL